MFRFYSSRMASTGLICMARLAGRIPATRPPATSTASESMPVENGIWALSGTGMPGERSVSAADSSPTGQCQPENAGHERQYESLAHDLRDDRARLGSQCAANAYLLRPLADGHQHDVADADDTRQQGAQTDDPCKDLQPAKQTVGHLDLFAHVPDHHRFRVVGRQRVAAVDDLFYALFDAGNGNAVIGRHRDLVQALAVLYIRCTVPSGSNTEASEWKLMPTFDTAVTPTTVK